VIRFLSERAKHIQNEIDDVEKRRSEAETLHTEYIEKIKEIENQKQQIISDGKKKATEESIKILNETHEKAKLIISEAEARIDEEKGIALEEIQIDVTQLATEMAARILKREVSADDNNNVINEFFKK